MQQGSLVNRRQFLTNISAVGLFTLFPFLKEKPVVHKSPDQEKAIRFLYKNALITVLEKQASYHGHTLSRQQLDNLVYACDKIQPANHQETAFVVACSMSYQMLDDVIDEYVRRRKGNKSMLPDHPVMALETWAVPDTKRIIIFKEQMRALLFELTDMGNSEFYYGTYRGILQKKLTPDIFGTMLNEKYRKLLTSEEIATILDAMKYYFPKVCPYHWCSTMASRATTLISKTGGNMYG